MNIVRLDSTTSTNTWTALHDKDLESPSLVYSINQTAGRGQRGNSWESQPGKNITASLIFHPDNFPAHRQFLISEIIALAIVDFLKGHGISAKIKWPNDIYVGNKKICGILVEHVVVGKTISRSIAGFGININQEVFLSDAPNPVSLSQLTGLKYDIETEINSLASIIGNYLAKLSTDSSDINHDEFLKNLWRHDGNFYKFFDRNRTQYIEARINSVSTDGTLTLSTIDGDSRKYAFKEIEFVI